MPANMFNEKSMFSIEETNQMLEMARRRTQISVLSIEIAIARGMDNPAEAKRLETISKKLEDNIYNPDPIDIPQRDLNYERRDHTWN